MNNLSVVLAEPQIFVNLDIKVGSVDLQNDTN